MNKLHRSLVAGALAMGAWHLAACSPAEQTAEPPRTSARQPADAVPEPRMKPAGRASPGKPTAPIAIAYELSAAPRVGQPIEVRITARVAAGMIGTTLELQTNDALLAGAVALAGDVESDRAERAWTVTVTPLQDGPAYLSVTVSAELDGQRQARSLIIPIRAGDAKPAAASAAAVKADESGEALILLPAQETP